MIGHEQYKDGKAGYVRLYNLLKDNKLITPGNNTPSALKGVVAGAAIHHFSTLSPQQQFEIVAGYLNKIGDQIITK